MALDAKLYALTGVAMALRDHQHTYDVPEATTAVRSAYEQRIDEIITEAERRYSEAHGDPSDRVGGHKFMLRALVEHVARLELRIEALTQPPAKIHTSR